ESGTMLDQLYGPGNETVGDYRRGYMATAAIRDEDIDRERAKSPTGQLKEGAGRLLTRRYVYCDIDGLPHWSVPYYEFDMLNRRINRMRLAHALEVLKNIRADDMQMIDANAFLTLTDSI